MIKENRYLISQENKKVEELRGFSVDLFKKSGLTEKKMFAKFFYDEEKKRNRYEILSIRRLDKKSLEELNDETYRGHVDIYGVGSVPLFVKDFPFPLYSTRVCFLEDGKYVVYFSPISFKLKDKENRLCFDVIEKVFEEIADIRNDNFVTLKFMKATKLEIPCIKERA